MLHVMLRELRILCTQRRLVLVVLLGAAAAYSLLIGNLYNGHVVTDIPIVVCDLDNSAASRDFVRALADVDTYRVIATDQQEDGEYLISQGKAAAMVVIPPAYSGYLLRGEQAPVAVIADGTNTLQQGYALNNMQEVVGTLNAAYAAQYYAVQGLTNIPPVPVQLSIRVGDNPTNSYALFYLYGVMLTAAQIGVMLALATSVHQDRRTPYHTVRAIAAKEIFYAVGSLMAAGLGLLLLVGVWNLPFKGSLLPMVGLYAGFVFTIMNMAVLAAQYFRTQIAMVQCLVYYALPAFLLSGYIWPDQAMLPLWKGLAALIPLHYIMADFRSLALTGTAPQAVPDMAVLFAMAAILIVVNVLWIRRQRGKREKIA